MKKGNLTYWEIRNVEMPLVDFRETGLETYAPAMSPKSALIRAIKKVLRLSEDDKKKFYRELGESGGKYRFFTVVNSTISIDDSGEPDISFNKEVVINFEKLTGAISCKVESPFMDAVRAEYDHALNTIDSAILRTTIHNFLERKCHITPFKNGVYFIDQRFDAELNEIKGLLKPVLGASLVTLTLVNDDETLNAIETAADSKMNQRIEDVLNSISRIPESGITKNMFDSREDKVTKLLESLEIHKENLRTKHSDLETKILEIQSVFDSCRAEVIDPDNFLSLLQEL